jgi:hypothetical protein
MPRTDVANSVVEHASGRSRRLHVCGLITGAQNGADAAEYAAHDSANHSADRAGRLITDARPIGYSAGNPLGVRARTQAKRPNENH